VIQERASGTYRSVLPLAALVLAGVLGSIPQISAGVAQETLTLAFSPPDGTRFVETLSWTRNLLSDGELIDGGQHEGQAEYVIRRMGTGYSVTVTPAKVAVAASRKLQATMKDMFANATMTYHLDQNGQLVRVVGAAEAWRKTFEMFSEKDRKLLQDMHARTSGGESPDALAAAQWSARGVLGLLSGRTVTLGKPYTSSGIVPLPIGISLNADVTMDFSRYQECPTCVAISVTHQARDPKVGVMLSDMIRANLLGAMQQMDSPQLRAKRRKAGAPVSLEKLVPALKYGDFTFEGTTIRILDAATGLPRREISTQKVRGTLTVEGERSTIELAEGSENKYQYPVK
jgi:hypothetical protein